MSRNTSTKIDYVALITSDPEAFDAATVEAYKAAADNKARAEVRGLVKSAQESAMTALDAHQAKYWLNTANQLKVDSAKAERPEVPVEQVIARRAAVLARAAQALVSGLVSPDGVTLPEGFDVATIQAAYEALASDDSEVNEAAVKLARTKITRSVERHSIGEVIVRAFESDESDGRDLLTIAEVRRFGSVEGYQPSPGAIRAHLEGSSPVEGYELVPQSGDRPFSVRKVA
jgi:hypothetical protein